MPGATIKKRSVKRVELRAVFRVCHAISMAMTVVLPAPVASLSAIRGSSGFIARSRSLSARGAISDNQIAVSAASIWQKNSRRGQAGPACASGSIEDKESMRWLLGGRTSRALLTMPAFLVVVGDRESDIYSCFRPSGGWRRSDRSRGAGSADRRRAAGAGGDASLFTSPAAWPELTQMLVKVAPRRVGDPGRIATVALRTGPVILKRPRHGSAKTDPETVAMTLVEAREINPPANQEPLHWRLLTSLEVGDAEAACEIVRLYRLRWRIEEVFRALKSDGMRLEETQMHEAQRLFKLAVVGLATACRTMQLVDARNGSPRPATDVIDAASLSAAEAIGATLEGKTERQKNPHPPHSLAWLAWIIARLCGWNCYYKPPGPKTMRAGWGQFESMAAGFTVATTFEHKSNLRIP